MARGFNLSQLKWSWVFGSIAIFFVAQFFISLVFGLFGVLTLGIGFVLFLILKPVTYFVGGYLTGRFSEGVTLAEPAIGAVIVTLLGTIFDISHIHHHGLFWALLSSAVAFVCALVGAVFGEDR